MTKFLAQQVWLCLCGVRLQLAAMTEVCPTGCRGALHRRDQMISFPIPHTSLPRSSSSNCSTSCPHDASYGHNTTSHGTCILPLGSFPQQSRSRVGCMLTTTGSPTFVPKACAVFLMNTATADKPAWEAVGTLPRALVLQLKVCTWMNCDPAELPWLAKGLWPWLLVHRTLLPSMMRTLEGTL